MTDSSFPDQPFFSGRRLELDRLTDYVNECLKGKGKTVFVVGEAGIGKTRLVDEVKSRASHLGFRVLTGQCLPSSSPFLPFEEALKDYFRIRKSDSDDTTRVKISKTVRREAPEILYAVQTVQLLFGANPVKPEEKELGIGGWLRGAPKEKELGLKEWLKGPASGSHPPDVIDVSREGSLRERFLQTVSSLIVEIAKREAILLFLDDLQWADPSSLALLHFISRKTKGSKVLIIGAYRHEELGHGQGTVLNETLRLMSREDLFVKVEVRPLDKQAYSNILREMFGSDFGHEFVGRLHEETEGNPLYGIETVRLLVQDGAIREVNGKWALSLATPKIRIPDKVRDVILRRLSMVTEEDRRILELGAVIGEKFESAALQEILGMNRVRLLQSLSTIQKTYSLIHSVDSGYRFAHSKLREVIYDDLSPELRTEYHSEVADWMERRYMEKRKLDEVVPLLADHFQRGKRWEKALTYFTMAGDIAMQTYAHEEANRAYEKALEASQLLDSTPALELRASLLERKALAAMVCGKKDEALRSLDDLAEMARKNMNKALYGKAKLLLGWACFWNKDLENSMKNCQEALNLSRDLHDSRLEARSLYVTGITLLGKGSSQQAKQCLSESLRISKEVGDRVTETQTLLVLLMEGFD